MFDHVVEPLGEMVLEPLGLPLATGSWLLKPARRQWRYSYGYHRYLGTTQVADGPWSRSARSRSDGGLVCRRDGAVAWREGLARSRPFPDHIFHRYRCHFGLAVVWRCSQSDACKLVAAAWLVGATNSTPGTDHSQHGGAARSRYCFIRSATAYGSSRLHAPERGSARSPTRGWPPTSGGQHRQAPRRRAEDSSEALGNSAEALGNSARGDRCTGAQTDPGNGASATFSVSISFSTTALRPTAHDLPKTRTPPECGAGSRDGPRGGAQPPAVLDHSRTWLTRTLHGRAALP